MLISNQQYVDKNESEIIVDFNQSLYSIIIQNKDNVTNRMHIVLNRNEITKLLSAINATLLYQEEMESL